MKTELIEYQLINYKYEIFLNDKKDSRGRGSILIHFKDKDLQITTVEIEKIIKDDISNKLKLNENNSIKIVDKEIIKKNIYSVSNQSNIQQFKYLTIKNILLGFSLIGITYYLFKRK